MLPEQDGSVVPMDAPVAVKEAVLPFKRFRTKEGRIVDSVLGPEMRSTGEVMGIDAAFPKAFAKSQVAAYGGLPSTGTVFVSVADSDKRAIVLPVLRLQQLGFTILATDGTAEILARNGIAARVVRKYGDKESSGGDEPTIVELIDAGEVDMVINTPSGRSARADGYQIRTATVAADKPLFTTIAQLGAAVASVEAIREPFTVRSLQNYALDRAERLARSQHSDQARQSQSEPAAQSEQAPQLEQVP
jgi:carbamoyl-phosphate synthase large subunit